MEQQTVAKPDAAEMIGEMFGIQNALNTKSYDSAWIDKGLSGEFDYPMAAVDEVHEFLRSLPFQWWTKDQPDRQNQVTELVDAWHFIMSQYIIDHGGDVQVAAESVARSYPYTQMGMNRLEPTVKQQAKKLIVSLYGGRHQDGAGCVVQDSYIECFFLLLRRSNISLELLYARYIAKATLNKFRVANGYKQGTYMKKWALAGEVGEDNFFLSRFVDQELEAGHQVPSEEDVNHFLTRVYAEVQAEATENLST